MASGSENLKCNRGRCKNFITINNKNHNNKFNKNRLKIKEKNHIALFKYRQLLLSIFQFMPVLWEIVALTLFFVSLGGSVTAAEAASATVIVVTTEINVQTTLPPQLQLQQPSDTATAQSISPQNLKIKQAVYENNYTLLVAATTTATNSINVPSTTASTIAVAAAATTFHDNISKTTQINYNNDNNNNNNSIHQPLNSIIPRDASSAADATVNSSSNTYEMEIEMGMVMGLDVPSLGVFTAATSIFDSQNINQAHNVSLASATSGTTEETEIELPPVHTIIVSILLLLVIIGTVVGNVLVCIAVCMVRKLRRPCNYLLVSLALSDLCVAVLVMPIALLYEVLEKWNFGPLVCDIWVSFDVLCCTASILNLCAISVDRYLAITKPLEYGVKRTPRRMMLCVALVWLGAACISLPPLLILGNEHQDEQGEPKCNVCQNFGYQIYATLGSFYIPLAVMLFVYYQIFRAARRIVLEEKRAQTHLQHALNGTSSPTKTVNTTTDICGDTSGSHLHLGSGTGGNGHRNSSFGNSSLLNVHGTGSNLLGSPHQKKLRFQLAKEKKASTTLGIIMSAFTICWLPFFILALIRPFESTTYHVPQSITSLFLWLGYANSLLNPIIYATLNRDFRKPFQEILYFRCSSLNTMMRENYYHDQYGEPPSQRVMLGDERHGARESFL